MNEQAVKPSVGLVIQARVGSTRLPQKIILPFHGGQSILHLLVNRLKEQAFPIVLATSINEQDDLIVDIAQETQIPYFRGDEQDVLGRFLGACEKYGFDFVVRVCADNPFLSLEYLRKLMGFARDKGFDFDYMSFTIDGIPSILTHYGFFVELVKTEALRKVARLTTNSHYREHVTNYIYKHPDLFKIAFVPFDPKVFVSKELRLTVDTRQDFDLQASLYQELISHYGRTDPDAINDYLSRHPEIIAAMTEQKISNTKK